ncbi:MAG: aconitate hydratase AcnA [Candidatus Heimdallarchaeota archaeon]|nr:MAG: aconitate hydratase AcnA [Candidatus Heimdallarchaeota archaeon]
MNQINEDVISQTKSEQDLGLGKCVVYSLPVLEKLTGINLDKLPFSIRVLLENVLRNYDGKLVTLEHVNTIADWPGSAGQTIPYMPSRVLLQDLTGVPLIVDMAAIRAAVHELGGDPTKINPLIPTDLVIDHSVQVDFFGVHDAYPLNLEKEYERNSERYKLIKWAQNSFDNTRIVPTGSGICHQVNLEYLASVVDMRDFKGEMTAVPDTCVGTDSHTPMVNGVAVIGWGVGGIEAEAVMLGQPYYMPLPEVIGIKLTGTLPEGTTATDLVLTITEILRKRSLVGRFVEYFGPGVASLTVPDRATLSNMSPEQAITIGFFPIDNQTISYLKLSGRDPDHINFVENYAKKNKLFRHLETPDPTFTEVIEVDLNEIKSSISGPLNPEEQVIISEAKGRLNKFLEEYIKTRGRERLVIDVDLDGMSWPIREGDLVIAAITSCTNTSNPSVMVGAGILAKKAVELGLRVKPFIKTSLAPGSKVVTDYLDDLGLSPYLEALGFHLVGYGCTTCIGNSGPLRTEIEEAIRENDLYVTSVLSGNRNYGGRIHQLTRGNFLASPILVVAYALAGTIDIDITTEPIGYTPNGKSVFLKDIWPSQEEIHDAINRCISADIYKKEYAKITEGDPNWQKLEAPTTTLFEWDPTSTYIKKPPFFNEKFFSPEPKEPEDIKNASVLILLEDKVSTDHISPAGAIATESPAGKYLIDKGIPELEFNTYGSRRGNHEVMMRGTFANVRVRNQLTPDKEGWWTKYHPTGEITSVYDAAMKYDQNNITTVILGSNLYGVGSSRDWAAKGPALLGTKAVIAKSFERIHRSNLIGMGVLPLEFEENQGWQELGIEGTEKFDIIDISEGLTPKKKLKVIAHNSDGSTLEFSVIARLDSDIEVEYYKSGGILQYLVSTLS